MFLVILFYSPVYKLYINALFCLFCPVLGPCGQHIWGDRGTHNPVAMTHVVLGVGAYKEVSILHIWHPIVYI